MRESTSGRGFVNEGMELQAGRVGKRKYYLLMWLMLEALIDQAFSAVTTVSLMETTISPLWASLADRAQQ